MIEKVIELEMGILRKLIVLFILFIFSSSVYGFFLGYSEVNNFDTEYALLFAIINITFCIIFIVLFLYLCFLFYKILKNERFFNNNIFINDKNNKVFFEISNLYKFQKASILSIVIFSVVSVFFEIFNDYFPTIISDYNFFLRTFSSIKTGFFIMTILSQRNKMKKLKGLCKDSEKL